MSLHRSVIKGASWRVVGRISSQVVQFGIAVVMARLLSPNEYGLIAIASVFLAFAGSFSEMGFGVALIQRKELHNRHSNSAFWANLGIGLILVIVFYLVSPWIAEFYSEPELRSIIPVLAIVFLLGPFGMVQNAHMYRNMNFRSLAVVEISTTTSSGIIGVILALMGYGVWSLVVSSLLGKVLNVTLSWWYIKWLPHFRFDKQALHELLSFGGNFTFFNIIEYIGKSMDRLLIGKFMGAHDVGVYNRAYAVMLAPFTQIVWTGASVLLPALASIQEDKARVGQIFLRAISLITFIALPALLGLIILAEPFVNVLFGPKWMAATPILQIFCLLGLSEIIRNMINLIIESQGATSRLVWLGSIQSVTNIIVIMMGISTKQLAMVALGVVVANYIVLFFYIRYLEEIVKLKFAEIVKAIRGGIGCALGMALIVFINMKTILINFGDLQKITISVLLGILIYGLLSIIFKPKGWLELKMLSSSGLSIYKSQI